MYLNSLKILEAFTASAKALKYMHTNMHMKCRGVVKAISSSSFFSYPITVNNIVTAFEEESCINLGFREQEEELDDEDLEH